jgi:hypothetical protein
VTRKVAELDKTLKEEMKKRTQAEQAAGEKTEKFETLKQIMATDGKSRMTLKEQLSTLQEQVVFKKFKSHFVRWKHTRRKLPNLKG